ncbi:hypothetical protein NP233_g404 [Leucocoprinus birnbaumii]|uniref:Nephrocystin 3-like N-terminal domain-containing protein n=1 Tax=Leucocoprinus birnbaumii TaxID=56174 RepID=A0AAD5W5J9_9AGAR|nr:hypothetical protein NP233_g404 [Leucocoprinus birnbaumii]
MTDSTASTSTRILEGASNVYLNNPTIIDNSRINNGDPGHRRSGLDKLLDHSMRDAFHDSSARWPLPRCQYDSRQELRMTVINWVTGTSKHIQEPLLWIYGPFGVGKTAIAQSCADTLVEMNKLGASLFFSRPNNRNNPYRVITSIVYQLALRSSSFGDILDREITKNPTLLTAIQPIQFQELLVKPLRELKSQGHAMESFVIILDGLDEVDGANAQCDIIDLVIESIQAQTTPFRWFILSRPEPHILRSMQSGEVSPLVHKFNLLPSSNQDPEILTFYTKELEKIGRKYHLPGSWCSEADIVVLANLADGLWVYVNTVTRFIGDPNSLGPATQLRLVLALADEAPQLTNPLAAMDLLYSFILRQIPSNIILTTRKILLLNKVFPPGFAAVNHSLELADVLGLSQADFNAACGFLQSVLYLQDNGGKGEDRSDQKGAVIQFYHASFMEYLEDRRRSPETFCIYSDCLEALQREIIQRIDEVHASSEGSLPVFKRRFPRSPANIDDPILEYYNLIVSLFGLCGRSNCNVSTPNAAALQNLQFSKIPRLLTQSRFAAISIDYRQFRENLPPEDRDSLFRRSRNPLRLFGKQPADVKLNWPFILGRGPNKLVCWEIGDKTVEIVPVCFILATMDRNIDNCLGREEAVKT